MLEKSFGLLFFLKQPRNYVDGAMYIYLRITVDGEARKQLIDSGRIVTAAAIMDIMSGAEQRKRELMSLFKAHNDEMKAMIGKGVAKGTWTNFNTTYRHLFVFLQTQYNVREINIVSLDLEFVKGFYNWFRTVKGLGHNSSLKNIANMKKIILAA